MKVRTRAVMALLAGSAILFGAGCSAGETPQAPTGQQHPTVQQPPVVPQKPADQQAAGPGYLQLGHLAPDAPSFNGYFARFGEDGQLIGSGGYGNLSPYMALPPGNYVWSMRPTDSPPDSPLMLTKLIEVKGGQATSVVLFNTGPQGSLQSVATPDDTAAPPAGMGKVRVVQGAAGASLPVDVGEQPTQDLAYGTVTPYMNVPAGPLRFRATESVAPMTVDVAPGSLNTVLVTRSSAGVKCVLVPDRITGSPLGAHPPTDAHLPTNANPPIDVHPPAGARAPASVNSGSGGLAASSTSSPMLIEALAGSGALLVLIAGAILLAGRRRNA